MNWRWYLALIVVSLAFGRWYFDAAVRGGVAERITVSSGVPGVPGEDRYLEFPDGNGVVPQGYPTDVPLHPAGRIVSTVQLPRPGWMHWNVVFEVDVPAADLEAWYRAHLNERGWATAGLTDVPASEGSAEATALSGTKGRRRLEIIWGGGERSTVTQTLVEPVD